VNDKPKDDMDDIPQEPSSPRAQPPEPPVPPTGDGVTADAVLAQFAAAVRAQAERREGDLELLLHRRGTQRRRSVVLLAGLTALVLVFAGVAATRYRHDSANIASSGYSQGGAGCLEAGIDPSHELLIQSDNHITRLQPSPIGRSSRYDLKNPHGGRLRQAGAVPEPRI